MPLRIRFQYPTGQKLGYSVERLSDGTLLDFADGTFKPLAQAAQPIQDLPEDSGIFAGRYRLTLESTPAEQFSDGNYAVTVHDLAAKDTVVAQLAATFAGGDDFPVQASVDKLQAQVNALVTSLSQAEANLLGEINKPRTVNLMVGEAVHG